MTEIISENITNTSEEDWAIFPFDQTIDSKRWVKLIEEMDVLENEAEGNQFKGDEDSVEAKALK